MENNKTKYSQKKVRKYLTKSFSKSEIKIICFDLGIDYEEFSEAKSMLVVDLLRWLIQKQKVCRLVEWLEEEVPSFEPNALEALSPVSKAQASVNQVKREMIDLLGLDNTSQMTIAIEEALLCYEGDKQAL